MTPLVDIGANLANKAFRADVDRVIERALQAGVGAIVVTGTSVESSLAARDLARRHAGTLWSTAGMHPHHASRFDEAVLSEFRALTADPEVVAVGECGLDYNRNFSPERDQLRCFEAHLALAEETDLPLFLHEREAHAAFVSTLEQRWNRRSPAVVHCFTGTEAELERYLALGLYVGITGWICDERRGGHLKPMMRRIPADRLLVETDAPYLMPRDMPGAPRNGRNEPAFLPHVVETIARARGESTEEVAAATTANARRFFRLPA